MFSVFHSCIAMAAMAIYLAALPASASLTGISYSDNKCTGTMTAVKFQTDASLKVVWYPVGSSDKEPKVIMDYSYACANGVTYYEHHEVLLSQMTKAFAYSGNSWDPQPKVTYTQSVNRFTFEGTFKNGGLYQYVYDPYLIPLSYQYSYRLGNPKVPEKNLQIWNTEKQAIDGLAILPKYNSGTHTVESLLGKVWPAYPFDGNVEDTTGMMPRPFLRITYTGPTGVLAEDGPPKYFATIYCFPGQGDLDYFNRPLLVADAFDPVNRRTAAVTRHDKRLKALLSPFDSRLPLLNQIRISPRAVGYDVFFVDFSQGGGNQQINASLMLKFIEWMHAKTPHPMIVGGPSQGGIIARLALLYSLPENNTLAKDFAPRVKGYLSIDSPHRGASITTSVQKVMYDVSRDSDVNELVGWADFLFGNAENTAKAKWRDIRTPAAHQMLFDHYYPELANGSSNPTKLFYGWMANLGKAALGDARGYRKDMPKAAIAYSNLRRPVPALTPTTFQKIGQIKIHNPFTGSDYTWDYHAGGLRDTPMWQEFTPGSSGDWYYSAYTRTAPKYMRPNVSNTEHVMGTFLPFASALDLSNFDPMVPPTSNERELAKLSPFDAVFYMRDEYNGYETFKDPAKPGLTDANARRYQHGIFDPQVMTATVAALRAIEDQYHRKVTSLPSYEGGYAQITLAGGRGWQSIPRSFPEFNWSNGTVTGFRVNNIAQAGFAKGASDGKARILEGDFNGDLIPDLLMTHGHRWFMPGQALSTGYDGLTVPLTGGDNLGISEVSKLNVADFNRDGRDDILILGSPVDNNINVGISRGDGLYDLAVTPHAAFAAWARQPEVKIATGDFNHDYYPDIALAGGAGWTQVHVAHGSGTGTFTVRSYSALNFSRLAAKKGAILLAGAFRSNSEKGLALLADNLISTFRISGTSGIETGSVFVSPEGYPFWSYAADPRTSIVAADYNGDGRTDLAILGMNTFNGIPVALSKGDGTFTLKRDYLNDFPAWATVKGAKVFAMDVNQDMRADLVMTGGTAWKSMPVALSKGDGTFTVHNPAVSGFPDWAQAPEVMFPYHVTRAYER